MSYELLSYSMISFVMIFMLLWIPKTLLTRLFNKTLLKEKTSNAGLLTTFSIMFWLFLEHIKIVNFINTY